MSQIPTFVADIFRWLQGTTVQFVDLMIAQFLQLWPYWVSGVFLGAFAKQYLKGEGIRRLLIASGPFAIPVGAVLGAASPLCLFGALPILSTLIESGLPMAAVWAFLVSSPLMNPNLFILTLGGLGLKVALARLVVAFGMGLVAGFIIHILSKRGVGGLLSLRQGVLEVSASGSACNVAGTGRKFSWNKVWKDFLGSLTFTGRYLLIGMAVAALFDMIVPTVWVMKFLGGSQNGFAVLVATGLGVPLYMCGGGSIPLIREWMYVGGLSMGGAMAFMIAGPSTKVSNFAALIPALGRKGFAVYLTINLVGALVVGYGIDLLMR